MTVCIFFITLRQAPNDEREYPVILFAVSVSCAYVVTPATDYPLDAPDHPELWGVSNFYSDNPKRSIALVSGYDAHFVPVKFCGRVHCVTGIALPPPSVDTDFQAATAGVDASEWLLMVRVCIWLHRDACCAAAAHELVALSPQQALPVAVVWLRRP
jgi:hypothetical protein